MDADDRARQHVVQQVLRLQVPAHRPVHPGKPDVRRRLPGHAVPCEHLHRKPLARPPSLLSQIRVQLHRVQVPVLVPGQCLAHGNRGLAGPGPDLHNHLRLQRTNERGHQLDHLGLSRLVILGVPVLRRRAPLVG
jgi:hypothetical protein